MPSTLQHAFASAGAIFDTGETGRGPLNFGDARAEYAALTAAAGMADFSDRTQIEVRGADRQTFLHNLSTNEVRRLAAGSGCEAFLCNPQGHVLALVYIFCGPELLVLETVPGQEAKLLAHLDRYLIREQVELHPCSDDWAELLVAGAGADELLRPLIADPPQRLFDHVEIAIGATAAWLRRVDFTLPLAYLVACPREAVAAVWGELLKRGAKPCGSEAVEMARLEAGTPYYGRDITETNLPQEVARDARAISFVKGCYIGQETVARLDALGHVNRTLAGVRFETSAVPAAGCELIGEGGKVAGQVTSAAFSPRLAAPLALAYVRRGMNSPGTNLASAAGPAQVVALPL